MSTSKEPTITINGIPLTNAQCITTRMALIHFSEYLNESNVIDELGEIGPLYRKRVNEILNIIFKS